MAIKLPSQRKEVTPEEAEKLANELADRPYNTTNTPVVEEADTAVVAQVAVAEKEEAEELARTTISLPRSMLEEVEDLAISRKRSKSKKGRTSSAIVREALQMYLKKAK